MNNKNKKKTNRIAIWSVCGGIVGFLLSIFNRNLLSINRTELLDWFVPNNKSAILYSINYALRGAEILLLLVSLIYFFKFAKKFASFLAEKENITDELDRLVHANWSLALSLNSILMVVSLVSLMIAAVREDLFFIVDLFVLILTFLIYRNLMLKRNQMLDIDVPLDITTKELKNNILQQDEAELFKEYKTSFYTVVNLSGILLPTLYFLLFILSVLTKHVELVAFIIVLIIHIFILIGSLLGDRKFYRQ
ncbi:MAG: DUF3169 family protein [Streptococcus sp.]|nr:DUF3169 family protein [Streptococcus sp.]